MTNAPVFIDEAAWQAENLARIERHLCEIRDQEDDTLFTEWWNGHFIVLTKAEGYLRLWMMEEEVANTTWVQSILDLEDPLHLVLGYTQAMLLTLAWQPDPHRVFVSGLGGGSLPLVLHHHYPKVVLDCVEISPEVVAATTTYMPLPVDQRVTVTVADAAEFLAMQAPGSYDILLLGLFTDGGKTPNHVTDQAFFESCHQRLAEDGVLSMNLYSLAEGHAQRLERVHEIFESVYICKIHSGIDVVLAAKSPPIGRFAMLERSIEVQKRRQFHFRLPDWVKSVTTRKKSL